MEEDVLGVAVVECLSSVHQFSAGPVGCNQNLMTSNCHPEMQMCFHSIMHLTSTSIREC